MESEVEDWEIWKGDIPFWKHSLAGSCAGVVEHSFFFPLDTIKTCLQSGKISGLTGNQGLLAYIKNNNFRSLFRGISAVILGNIPAHASLFTTYELSKRMLAKVGTSDKQSEDSDLHYINGNVYNSIIFPAICGGLSTISHDIIATPLDVIKQRLQLGSYRGINDCVITILKKEGIKSFYRSLPITLFTNIPQTGLFVLLNENLKNIFKDVKKDSIKGSSYNFIFAGISGGMAGFITNPLDLIKTKLQTQACHTSQKGTFKIIYPNVRKAFIDTYYNCGLRGMYSGALTRALLIAPSYALCWGTYETIKNFL